MVEVYRTDAVAFLQRQYAATNEPWWLRLTMSPVAPSARQLFSATVSARRCQRDHAGETMPAPPLPARMIERTEIDVERAPRTEQPADDRTAR